MHPMPGMAFAIPTTISPRRRLSATVGNGFCHSHHHPQAPCKNHNLVSLLFHHDKQSLARLDGYVPHPVKRVDIQCLVVAFVVFGVSVFLHGVLDEDVCLIIPHHRHIVQRLASKHQGNDWNALADSVFQVVCCTREILRRVVLVLFLKKNLETSRISPVAILAGKRGLMVE